LVGTTKGVEFAPEWKPTTFWRLRATYSYLQMNIKKARNSADIGTAPTVEGSSPRHQATAQSEFEFAKRFSLDFTYRFVSALPKAGIRSYSTADVHFGWQLTEEVELSVVGQNLFQPHHFETPGDPGPVVGIKRGVYGQVTWKR
jgi:iron complex outermembrane receptor protein